MSTTQSGHQASPFSTSSFEVVDERVSEIRRALDGLNSADPAIRLTTVEALIESNDRNLKVRALNYAIESQDPYISELAIKYLVSDKDEFSVSVVNAKDKRSREFMDREFRYSEIVIYPLKLNGEILRCTNNLS